MIEMFSAQYAVIKWPQNKFSMQCRKVLMSLYPYSDFHIIIKVQVFHAIQLIKIMN